MDLCKEHSLEIVSRDIYILRDLMYMAKDRVGCMDDPLVIRISQFLDLKLNQHGEMLKPHRSESEGMYMTKNKNSDDDKKPQSTGGKQEQLQWQKR